MDIIEDLKELPEDIAYLIVSFVDVRSDTCKIFGKFLNECQSLDWIIRQFYKNESSWYMNQEISEILLFEINLFKTIMQRKNTYRKACFLSRYYLARYFARGGLISSEFSHSNTFVALRRFCALYTNFNLYLPYLNE